MDGPFLWLCPGCFSDVNYWTYPLFCGPPFLRPEDVSRMAGRTHEEKRRAVAQRQECRGRHVEHQPAVAEESEGQAIETAEGEAGRRQDAHALQGCGSGCVHAEAMVVMAMTGGESVAVRCQGRRSGYGWSLLQNEAYGQDSRKNPACTLSSSKKS